MKVFTSSSLLIVLVGLMISLQTACDNRSAQQGQLFQKIFLDPESDFRGVKLGNNIQEVRSLAAPVLPHYQDRYGLSFSHEIQPGVTLKTDYYSDNLITGLESNKIASIVAQVELSNEVETARLYQEIKDFFDAKYNLAIGNYGDYLWSSATRDFGVMEIRLRLDDSKKGIVINFVDTQAGTHNEPS